MDRRHARRARQFEHAGIGLVGQGDRDISLQPAGGDGVENGAEIRAFARAEQAEAQPAAGAVAGEALDGAGCRPARHQRQDADLGAGGVQRGALFGVQRIDGVIAALGVDVRPDRLDEPGGALVAEDHHGVDRAQRGHDLGSVVLRIDRPGRSLELAHRGVRVQRHDQGVAERARLVEVADVAGVQQVEAAIGEDQLAARGIEPVAQGAHLGGRHRRVGGVGHGRKEISRPPRPGGASGGTIPRTEARPARSPWSAGSRAGAPPCRHRPKSAARRRAAPAAGG